MPEQQANKQTNDFVVKYADITKRLREKKIGLAHALIELGDLWTEVKFDSIQAEKGTQLAIVYRELFQIYLCV